LFRFISARNISSDGAGREWSSERINAPRRVPPCTSAIRREASRIVAQFLRCYGTPAVALD
jgi:hypothetical protein